MRRIYFFRADRLASGLATLGLLLLCTCTVLCQSAPARIRVDASLEADSIRPFWAFFGYDEPNYTVRPNGKKLLKELRALDSSVPVFVRTHNLLTSKGNSTGPDLKWGYTDAYKEDEKGDPVYNWNTIDSIIDTYVHLGLKPLMEIGFMPKDLSSKPEPYEHHWSSGGNLWTGWTYPPKDYKKWAELVHQWVKHSLGRYGRKEVESWLWEVWNEPNIGYWSGSFDEYCKLYDYAAAGLRQACEKCIIGGPHTTSPRSDKAYDYLVKFIDHCLHGRNYATGNTGSPLGYIGFHAKGSPEFIDGRIRMNMGVQLRDIQRAFEMVQANPLLRNIPVIIGECDPEGCAACSTKRDSSFGYRNGTVYSSYTAASFARIYDLMAQYNINLTGAVSWSFEFEDQPMFAGFRELATQGVDKPVLNIFRMLGMMHGKRISVQADSGLSAQDIIGRGVRNKRDINAIACREKQAIYIMVWNYRDGDTVIQSFPVELNIGGLSPAKVRVTHYRVDKTHSNSFEEWKNMGAPSIPSPEQYAKLESAGKLVLFQAPEWKYVHGGSLSLPFALPDQGVSLIKLSW